MKYDTFILYLCIYPHFPILSRTMCSLILQDEDLDTYLRTGKFEGAPVLEVPKRKYDLYCYIFWVVTTTIPLFYYLRYVVLYASIVHQTSLVAAILLCEFFILSQLLITKSNQDNFCMFLYFSYFTI